MVKPWKYLSFDAQNQTQLWNELLASDLLGSLTSRPTHVGGEVLLKTEEGICWLSDPIGDLRTMNTQVGTSEASVHEAKAMMNVNTAGYKEQSAKYKKKKANKRV